MQRLLIGTAAIGALDLTSVASFFQRKSVRSRQSACLFAALLLFSDLSFKGFPQFTPFYPHFDSRSTLSIVPCFIAID
jgi:hypothetical protein